MRKSLSNSKWPMTDLIDPDANRDFRTFIPDAVWEEYYSSLGKFFHLYAQVENNLNIVLTNIVEEAVFPADHYGTTLSDEERRGLFSNPEVRNKVQMEAKLSLQRRAAVRAVLGSMRFKGVREAFSRLMEITSTEAHITERLGQIFNHLGQIQGVRDRLAHNGATPDMRNKENWFYTTDSHTQNLERKASMLYFKASDLRDMTRDLSIIPELIFNLFNPALEIELAQNPVMQTPEMKDLQADLNGPFWHKPSNLRRVNREA